MANIRKTRCPYCGHINEYTDDIPFESIQTCDADEGGCDKRYAVLVSKGLLIATDNLAELTQKISVLSYRLER